MELFGALFSLMFFSVPLAFLFLLMLLGVATLIFTVWMIIDCAQRDFKDRDMWLIVLIGGVVLGYGLIASIIYYFVVKSKD